MVAGGPLALGNAFVALSVLRSVLRSTLPVELYFDGSSSQSLDKHSQRLLEVGVLRIKFPKLVFPSC